MQRTNNSHHLISEPCSCGTNNSTGSFRIDYLAFYIDEKFKNIKVNNLQKFYDALDIAYNEFYNIINNVKTIENVKFKYRDNIYVELIIKKLINGYKKYEIHNMFCLDYTYTI